MIMEFILFLAPIYLSSVFCFEAFIGRSGNEIKYLTVDRKTNDSWMKTMEYHRRRMTEYMCKNYLAETVVNSLNNRTITKRNGLEGRSLNNHLMEDTGSRKYKDWLARSTTLEDIYRQYEMLTAQEDASTSQTYAAPPESDGVVTGYAMMSKTPSGYGAGTSYSPQYDKADEHDEKKGIAVNELFQLALTAIAFLAFGMFFIHVIMCILGEEKRMDAAAAAYQTQHFQHISRIDEEVSTEMPQTRQERSFEPETTHVPIYLLNEMSSRVLSSIEAFTVHQFDDGDCMKKVLCDMNYFSRQLSGMDRIWLPLWSLGLSWIGGSTDTLSPLANMKASIIGLGNGNCDRWYKCDKNKLTGLKRGKMTKRN